MVPAELSILLVMGRVPPVLEGTPEVKVNPLLVVPPVQLVGLELIKLAPTVLISCAGTSSFTVVLSANTGF